MLTSKRALHLAVVSAANRSVKKARAAGFANLASARRVRSRRAEVRRRLGLVSSLWASRLRRKGRPVGDLAFLLRPYDLTEPLITRLISGDLRDLLDNSINAGAMLPVQITRPMNPLTQAARAWYEDRLRGFI